VKNSDKNTSKNTPSAPSLFPTLDAPRPLDSSHATAAQLAALLPFAGIDDTFLRNRAATPNPRTGAPWIPKPTQSRYPLVPTLAGLVEWFAARAKSDDLPAHYSSMISMENSLLTPREFIKWCLAHDCADAQDASGRINPRPILARAAQILRAIPTGQVTGIDGLEQWDKDTELAQKIRIEREDLEDQQKIRRGEMLLSRDATFAITELVADELIWEKRDQPLRQLLLNAPKSINRQHRTILSSDANPADKMKKCGEIVTTTISAILEKLRNKIPKRKPVENLEK
jgi:hypothetical protein